MYSFQELWGEGVFGRGRGSLDFDGDYAARRRPLWLVLLKILGSAVLIVVGFALLTPVLLKWLSLGNALALVGGLELIYLGAAFFLRPRPDFDNMGQPFFGGVWDDPLQYSDDINRELFGLHMLLGPGRFISETAVDAATWVGLLQADPIAEDADFETSETIEPLPARTIAPDRFQESRL